jgi:hypothetical protein
MITREDLENAAFAVGLPRIAAGYVAYHDELTSIVLESGEEWHPHTDRGQAAMLAVKMRMCVDVAGGRDDGEVIAFIDHKHPRMPTQGASHDGTDAGAERAYCEAITLCAAVEGKRMRSAPCIKATPGQIASQLAAIDEFDGAKRGER